MVDAEDLKSSARKGVWVRFPPRVLNIGALQGTTLDGANTVSMPIRLRPIVQVLLVIVAAAIIAACGGDDDDGGRKQATVGSNLAPDTTFAGDGVAQPKLDAKFALAYDVALDGDDVIAAGFESPGSGFAGAKGVVMRLDGKGRLDRDFGDDGIYRADLARDKRSGTAAQWVQAVGDGKLLVGAVQLNEDEAATAVSVVRLDDNGKPDADYGNRGVARVALDGLVGLVDIAADDDGAVYISSDAADHAARLVRLTPDGENDAKFGDGGEVTLDTVADETTSTGVVIADGKPTLVTAVTSTERAELVLRRYTSTGEIDAEFGTTAGSSIHELAAAYASGAVLDDDGQLYVGRSAADESEAGASLESLDAGSTMSVARFDTKGQLDTKFGDEGEAATGLSVGADDLVDMAVQPDGKLLVLAGDTGLARLTTAGSLDAKFGDAGVLRLAPQGGAGDEEGDLFAESETTGSGDDSAVAALGLSFAHFAIQDDGKLVFAAWPLDQAGFRVVRMAPAKN